MALTANQDLKTNLSCSDSNCGTTGNCDYTSWSSWTVCNSTCVDETTSKFRFRAPISPMEPGCTKTTDIEPCTTDQLPKCSERCKSADTDGFSFHKGIEFQ